MATLATNRRLINMYRRVEDHHADPGIEFILIYYLDFTLIFLNTNNSKIQRQMYEIMTINN
jgi:hypothetical protein